MEQSGDPIAWWQSRTIWWALVTAICNLLGLFGHAIPMADQKWATEVLLGVGSLVSVCMTIYWRVRARSVIAKPVPINKPTGT